MIKTKNIISSLPLLADALGRKYGIKVHIGGERAYTDGNEIHLPSLPLDADETAVNLARGYLDHESAHLRFTDFNLLKKEELSPIEKFVWNIIEDFLVERKLGVIYPGCGDNFKWLSKYLFIGQPEKDASPLDANDVQDILNWLLYKLRAYDVSELETEKIRMENCIKVKFPELFSTLNTVVSSIPFKCVDTASTIDFAREIVKILEQYTQQNIPDPPSTNKSDLDEKSENGNKIASNKSNNSKNDDYKSYKLEKISQKDLDSKSLTEIEQKDKIQAIKDTLENPVSLKPLGIGDMVENLLQAESSKLGNKLAVSTPMPLFALSFSPETIFEIRQQTMGLRTRLKGLLQTSILTRSQIGRTGKVESARIARLTVNDPKIFVKHGIKQGYSTAAHILLDVSGSMSGKSINLACQACYAVALALKNTPGIEVMVSAFPGRPKSHDENTLEAWQTVSPILKYGERLHDRFLVSANGGTPLAETLWWVFQQMQILKEDRKIVFILSDGEPNNHDDAVNAIQILRNSGIEIYGIGMATAVMDKLLGSKHSRSIYDLKELAPAMLDMLKTSLFDSRRNEK